MMPMTNDDSAPFDLDSPGLESVTLDEPQDGNSMSGQMPDGLSLADEIEGIGLDTSQNEATHTTVVSSDQQDPLGNLKTSDQPLFGEDAVTSVSAASDLVSGPPPTAATDSVVSLNEPSSDHSVPLAAGNVASSADGYAPDTSAATSALSNSPRYECKVSNPETVGEGMKAYVQYSLTSRNLDVQGHEVHVFRRFSDFVWLREKLSKLYPDVIIPPMPAKDFNPLSKFPVEFLEYRRRELDRFITRVSAHPRLSADEHVHAFFNAESEELEQKKADQPSAGITSQVFGFFSSKISVVAGKSLPDVFGTATEEDQWFEVKAEYITSLYNQLNALATASKELVYRHNQMKVSYSAFAGALNKFSQVEMGGSKSTSDALQRVSDISMEIQLLEGELAESERVHWLENLQDYIRIVDAVKVMFANRLESLGSYQAATKTLTSKRSASQTATGSKLTALQTEIAKWEEKEQEYKEVYELRTARAKEEYKRFEETKQVDIRLMIQRLAQMHMNHEVRVLDLWKPLLSDFA